MGQQWSLDDLQPGESALVKKLKHTGSMRRRMLDLGLARGTQVTCLGRGPGGDPASYLIRRAVIAIRARDASLVEVEQPARPSPPKGPVSREPVIALAGNPNVGKSTVFNSLTGMKQHTGNWPGKTVACAWGRCCFQGRTLILADLPGTYSLLAHSAEEEQARSLLCFGEPDGVVVVCDAACLERGLNLLLQILEITSRVVLCVNLMDEAKRRQIAVDLKGLEKKLGIPVVGTSARNKNSLEGLLAAIGTVLPDGHETILSETASPHSTSICHTVYPPVIEDAIAGLASFLEGVDCKGLNRRWLALKLLENDPKLLEEIYAYLGESLTEAEEMQRIQEEILKVFRQQGLHQEALRDQLVMTLLRQAEDLCRETVTYHDKNYQRRDRKLDALLTSRRTGYPMMLLLLAFVFWLTIVGANYPSKLLAQLLFGLQGQLTRLCVFLHAPVWLHDAFVLGVYRVLAWVVSVMLPPMAIFFPLFTLLEDAGYLPRIAYSLDHCFLRCRACGKQALTMCMGFGCNAVGVTGCRIIDSPRERILALLTNSLVPCNGRFPALLALLAMFFAGGAGESGSLKSTLFTALLLTGTLLLSIAMTFVVTGFLSRTLLKGVPSSFTLELPPYRRPQLGQILVRSLLDRTVFVLGRAASIAAPAGLLLWILANGQVGGRSLLFHLSEFLDPFARFLGLDGTILLAFFLGFPANEIILPIIFMAYTAQGSLTELTALPELKNLLLANGWTTGTALCTLLLFLFHWPCSTTLWTIRKETKSWGWTFVAFLLPTAVGFLLCALVSHCAAWFL
ncbi:MAG: ferrous iron transport protein B [Lachnospiraceae bacterium]|nr:ferrous iron transport protein B [Lachnospiraceae bacterium]